jgi:regulator of RNase E activity RraA
MKSKVCSSMSRRRAWLAAAAVAVTGSLLTICAVAVRADAPMTEAQYAANPQAMIEAYRHVEVASVSDALEQLYHEKHYMSHRMQSNFTAKFAGWAVTVKLTKEPNNDPNSQTAMLQAIDDRGAGSVYVMTVEDGADIAGMGGLMGTAMASRGYVGAVVDGGLRDEAQLRRIGFPVYSLGPTPATAVSHYRATNVHQPIVCDGVPVAEGDIVTADQDGVVVIPRAKAAATLIKAQQLDFTEHSMYPAIEKLHSIVQAVAQFGRI